MRKIDYQVQVFTVLNRSRSCWLVYCNILTYIHKECRIQHCFAEKLKFLPVSIHIVFWFTNYTFTLWHLRACLNAFGSPLFKATCTDDNITQIPPHDAIKWKQAGWREIKYSGVKIRNQTSHCQWHKAHTNGADNAVSKVPRSRWFKGHMK